MINPELENTDQEKPELPLDQKTEVPLAHATAPSDETTEPANDDLKQEEPAENTGTPKSEEDQNLKAEQTENTEGNPADDESYVNEPANQPVDDAGKTDANINEDTETPAPLKNEKVDNITEETTSANPVNDASDQPKEDTEKGDVTVNAKTETPSTLNNEQVEHIVFGEDEMDTAEDLPDFANLSKEDLLKTALKATAEKELSEALQIFKAIKPFFEMHLAEEKEQALSKYLEEGGDKDNFEFKGDNSKEEFNKAFSELRQRKEETRKRQEAEKLENLKKKEAILEEIKKLNDSEETENSLKRIKELQSEWKKIRNVPKEHLENLWESYRVLNEIFYDRLSINNELKELDRNKNLGHKIDLINRLSELAGETNIKKALIAIKKIQEEWRYIGPVPKEASEDLWSRFKAEGDKLFGFIKQKTEEMEVVRQQNLVLKQELLTKAREIAETKTTRIKEWMEKSNASNELMEAWKKIGHVPMAMRDQVWNEFRDARNTFYSNKNNYFKTIHAERNANLKAKEALCIRAESISANPIDWNKQTDELKKMQEDWKKIGQAPEKVNDAVWKRFRTACDSFFSQKSERYASQQQEQLVNLEAKNALIAKLEGMLTAPNTQNVFAELKQAQTEWNALGYVPAGQKDAVIRKYNDLLDKLYGKHKQLNKEIRGDRDQQNFEYLASSPNGAQKLQREEKILMERIKGLKKDIETWDNNLGFFKMGNSKNPLAEQIHSKIELANKLISSLEEKLKALKALRNKPSEPVNQ